MRHQCRMRHRGGRSGFVPRWFAPQRCRLTQTAAHNAQLQVLVASPPTPLEGNMGGKRQYKARDYAVGEQLLALRMRADLRQAELAALLHLSQRSIHNWENGEAYPSEVHLRHLLALAQQRGLFTPGSEQQEAEHLWTLVGERSTKPLGAFDPAWFASLPQPQGATPLMAGTSLPAAAHERVVDWVEAPDTR